MHIVYPLKLAAFGNSSVHGGIDFACAQAGRGHEVLFVSVNGSHDDVVFACGVHLHEATEAASVRSAVHSLREQIVLACRMRPDVLQAHIMSSMVLAWVAAALSSSTIITSMHNLFDGHSWLMRLGKRVIAISEAGRRLLLERRYRAKQALLVLDSTGDSPRRDLYFDDTGPLNYPFVVTLCGLHPRKADLIEGFAQLTGEFPDWLQNVIGWGAERDRLRGAGGACQPRGFGAFPRLDAEADAAPRVKRDLRAHVARRTLPLAVMEARTAGCAIIGTDVGGITEVLGSGSAGHLIPPKDLGAIAAAMRDLMSDPNTLAQWRTKAKTGFEYFSVERVADDHDVVYASVGRTSSRRRRSIAGLAA